MIKATDLRVGNHLYYYIGEEGIDWDISKIDSQDLTWCEEKNEQFNNCNKGIDLTISILIASGFIEDNNGCLWIDLETHCLEFIVTPDGFYPIYVQKPELSSQEEQRVSLKKIKFIHELENLFLILTGKELNLIL